MDVVTTIFSNLDIISVICFILGFALVILEMFFPGFGFPGISGIILLLAGIILTANTMIEAFILIIIILLMLGAILTVILRSANKGGLAKGVILSTSSTREEGYIGVGVEDMDYFLDKIGTTLTMLRPSGSVDFDGVKLDAIAEGEFVSKDKTVKVIKIKSRRLIVKEIKDEN